MRDKETEPCCSAREMTVVERLERQRDELIRTLADVNEAINYAKCHDNEHLRKLERALRAY